MRANDWSVVVSALVAGVFGCSPGTAAREVSLTDEGSAEPAVHPRFDVSQRATSPFPTNLLATTDDTQNTRLRVNLPMPDCVADSRRCADVTALNELDGFSLQPRVSIPFDGDIDPASVNGSNVFLVKLDGSSCRDDHGRDDDDDDDDGHDRGKPRATKIGGDQVVWDVRSRTLHVETAILEQHTRYALIVSRGVLDTRGQRIGRSAEFKRYRHHVPGDYRDDLREALRAARRAGVRKAEVAVASVFTTQSVTYRMEKIRAQLDSAPPATVSFNIGPNGERTVFALSDITKLTWTQHTRTNPDVFADVDTTAETFLLKRVPGAVAAIAYGKFSSPDYLLHPGETMPAIGTRTGTPVVRGHRDVYVNVIVPAGPRPATGWPVAIFGTGAQGTKETWLHRVGATLAASGIATVCIPFYGNGTGPKARLTIDHAPGGTPTTISFLSGGRAVDQNANGIFEPNEGIEAATTAFAIGLRDSYQQSTVDRMVLARAISGMDIDGDGVGGDLDASRIGFFGPSTGGQQGFILAAIDPRITASVFNEAAGPLIVTNWWGASRGRFGAELSSRGRLNPPGVTRIDGVTIPSPAFFDHVPLRAAGGAYRALLSDSTTVTVQSPVVNDRDGAMYAQELREWKKWAGMAGDPAGYAKHLREDTLAGTPARPFLYQVAIGDQTITNPTQLTVLRAGDFADRTSSYRHDLELADNPLIATDPHQTLIRVDSAQDGPTAVALQQQIALFLATGATSNPRPAYLEAPIVNVGLLETLNYTP